MADVTREEVIRRIEVCLQNAHDDSHHASETGQQLYDPIDQWGACLEALQNALTELTRPATNPSDGESVDELISAVRGDSNFGTRAFERDVAAARAAVLARMRGAAVQEGFAIVPKIPTDAMMVAALKVRSKNGSFKEMMAAMIEAAAPEVPR